MHRIIRLAAACVLMAGAAMAHAFLRSAAPAVGATLQAAPTQVVIDYTEAVEPRFSTIEVRDEAGVRMDVGPVQAVPGDDKRLTVALKTVTPGSFKVTWYVTSRDTHKTEGAYSFTVRP